MKQLLSLSMLILTATALNAQIVVNMSIEYQQNTDTILKDSVVPMLCIEFKNDTDSAQYFVLENYEKYPAIESSGMSSWCGSRESREKYINDFHYFVCNDMHYIYLKNKAIEISHEDYRNYNEDDIEIVEDFTATEFSLAYNYLRKHNTKHYNNSQQIVLLDAKQNFYVVYDLTMFALICGEYEFIFDMKPPDETFPPMISKYRKCSEFVGSKTLKFKP
ncbi:MAG: hypothetical protein II075_02115 [Bacteroidales bacterium]|jgi:hypothetical protein|nr:hypothetical protein [Bacteroidales bacterium]